jgi:hypothetical protein
MYSDLDNVLMYLGISSYFGEQRGCQDRGGTLLSTFGWRCRWDREL